MIKITQGNILEASENIICHSVNHRGVMGAGLALQLRKRYPDIMLQYSAICSNISFDHVRGNGTIAWHKIESDPYEKYIASIFGQESYGVDRQYTDYVSLGNGLRTVRMFAYIKNYSVAIPSGIGCGLGGGDWDIVEQIIQQTFESTPFINVTIYEYENLKKGSPTP